MKRQWWTLVVVCAATFMLLLDVTIVAVALPDVQHALGATFSGLQWTTDAYALSLAALLLTSGSLADQYGRRRLFLIGMVIFTLASLLCGVARSPEMLIASRAVQGVGGAILFTTSLALLASTFRGRARGTAFGVWGAVAGVATALGPILGGAITSEISWRGIFLVNLPIGVAALLLAARLVEESRAPRASRVDAPGVITLTIGLFSLVYALIRASEHGWGERGVLLWFGLAAIFLAAFVVVEFRTAEPMFDLSLLRTPTFLGGSIAAFTMNASLFAMFLYIVLYLQDDLGLSPLQTGVRLLVSSGGTLVAAMAAGRLLSHAPTRWLIGPGLVLVGAGLLLMRGGTADSGWAHLIPGFIVSGVGAGMVNPPLASTAIGVVPVWRAGMASGINQTFRQVGIAVGIALYGSVFSSSLVDALRDAAPALPGVDVVRTAGAVRQGAAAQAIAAAPEPVRGTLAGALHASFASAFDDILLLSGVIALAGGVLAALLIRPKDFVVPQQPSPAPAGELPVADRAGAPGSPR